MAGVMIRHTCQALLEFIVQILPQVYIDSGIGRETKVHSQCIVVFLQAVPVRSRQKGTHEGVEA